MRTLAFLLFCLATAKSLPKKSKISKALLKGFDFKTQASLHGHVGQTTARHPISVFCPLSWTAFSTRSAQLQPSPMEMPGVLPSLTGAEVGRRGGMARIVAMAGISVETPEMGHTTAHMVG